VKPRSPTTVLLYRARLIFTATALLPTLLVAVTGIVFVAEGGSKSVAVVGGILVLALCATALVGYVVGTIFVTRGAGLAAVQNEFLASVSHEVRTPLTSLRMFVDTLREDRLTDPAEKQRCLSLMVQELGRLDALVGKLIELSKIESRHAAFERRPVAVGDIVNDAVAMFDAVRLSREVDLRVLVQPGLTVQGDRAALAQAVGNLLGNAWKYTPNDGKRIEINAVAEAKRVVIAVTDNGAGIPPVEQKRIFDKFQRGVGAVDSGVAGAGLGLAIARAIVRAHKGRVDVRSTVDRGSSFRITLPLARGGN
jgi:two-component system, OmpR family, phosphate regulon sensor histidine kinase PhoR